MASTDTAAPEPPLSLLSLPGELLSVICGMAFQQDSDFRMTPDEPPGYWNEDSDFELCTPSETSRVLKHGDRAHGKSLSSLSATCRCLREVATPFLFETITLRSFREGRTIDIVRPHCHHVRTLLFEHKYAMGRAEYQNLRTTTKRMIKSSLMFRNISTFDIRSSRCFEAIRDLSEEVASGQSDEALTLGIALEHLDKKITILRVGWTCRIDTWTPVASLQSLQQVHFETQPSFDNYYDDAESAKEREMCWKELSDLKFLEILKLGDTVSSRSTKVPYAWSTWQWTSRHTLSTLEWTSVCLDENFWRFASIFSTSLKKLKISLGRHESQADCWREQIAFPLLEEFDVQANTECIDAALNALALSPLRRIFLRITDFAVELLVPTDSASQSQLMASIQSFNPTLRHLHLESTNRLFFDSDLCKLAVLLDGSSPSIATSRAFAVTMSHNKMSPGNVTSYYDSETGHARTKVHYPNYRLKPPCRTYTQEHLDRGIAELIEFATRKAQQLRGDLQGSEKLFMDLKDVWKSKELDEI